MRYNKILTDPGYIVLTIEAAVLILLIVNNAKNQQKNAYMPGTYAVPWAAPAPAAVALPASVIFAAQAKTGKHEV